MRDWSSDWFSSGLRGSDQMSIAFRGDLLPWSVRVQGGEVRCVICYPVRVGAREGVSRAPKNTERLCNTAPIRRANPRRSLWRCKLGGGGAGGYVSFGGGYAGVE